MAEDRLEPCGSSLPEYERRVEAITQEAMPGVVEFWVLVIPSFTPEMSVEVSVDNGRFLLTRVVLDQSFWHSSWVEVGPNTVRNDPSKGHARGVAKTTIISAELHSALRTEWERSINGARPSESKTLILDGESYIFRFPGRCASASSPESATRNGKLVDLVYALGRLAGGGKTANARTEAPVLRQLGEIGPLID